jgi:3-oxoacyl-[acyl-carrier-protein] synthase-3
VQYASIGPIALHFPEKVESIDTLRDEFPRWNLDLIQEKTGIYQRHIAADDEYASDLGVAAAEKLFEKFEIDRNSIDFLLFCTQTPDCPLPTTSCLMQQRLSLPTSCGALDFNLGCSGYVYGLAMANGLINSGAAKRILFITAETYTKYIDRKDRSLRTIFGDGAAASLIEASDEAGLQHFKFGTDGTGADMLLLTKSGPRQPMPPRNRHRWDSDLYMDGPSLISFTVDAIPGLVDEILASSGNTKTDIDYYLMHQATHKMLSELAARIDVPQKQVPIRLSHVGNTVSSTLPILIHQMRESGDLKAGMQNLLVGFGVGLSWAGCYWKETFQG